MIPRPVTHLCVLSGLSLALALAPLPLAQAGPVELCKRALRAVSLLREPRSPETQALDAARELKAAYNLARLHEVERGRGRARSLEPQLFRLKQEASSFQQASDSSPAWSHELLEMPDGGIRISTAWKTLRQALERKRMITKDDLALRFIETSNNRLELLAGKDEFWNRLMPELKAAKHSIRIGLFGMQPDPWAWEVANVLAEKARKGVPVELMADKLGARMSMVQFGGGIALTPPNRELFEFLEESGVRVVLTEGTLLNGDLTQFDHRKYAIIDGEVAYNTGYTFERHMREQTFDTGIRVEGDLVSQLTLSHLLNWLWRGGEFPKGTPDEILSSAFPARTRPAGASPARLVINVPGRQLPITEGLYERVETAKRRIYVIDPYPMDRRLLLGLKEAAEHHLDVRILVPSIPQNASFHANFELHVPELLNAGAQIYYFTGEGDMVLLHAKGILVDDWFSFGSCNKDAFTLFNNYEQQIESSDPKMLQAILARVFAFGFAWSRSFVPPPSLARAKAVEAAKRVFSPSHPPKPRK